MSLSAIVTGGANGIGRTITQTLLNAGWRVAILDIQPPAADFAVEALFIQTDVSRESEVAAAIRESSETFGGIQVLINNAGIGITCPLESLTIEEWHRVVDTNLTGTFLCSKHAAPHLRKTKGCIINIASTRAFQSEAHTEAYSASKGGIVALTHAMAISLGPEIRVNCISPGWIDCRPGAVLLQSDTDKLQHPCGRVGAPCDIADMVEFLISPKAGFITGQNFMVDGGMTSKMIYTE